MGLYDNYYRAFKEYRNETLDNSECKKQRLSISNSNVELDKLESIKYLCTIDEDWVNEIGKGLVYVEKAVREERQFIRQQGEVVPIEKAKKISKHSIEHLAKHSNMITHLPENEDDIIPDEIYMVEKLSDYAVYENRFLYMLLCYLRDFINLRLEKILKLRMTYISNLYLKKDIDEKKNNMSIELKFSEKRYDNPYPVHDNTQTNLLNRIYEYLQLILMLLDTDLMNQVAKTPMIKPPIVKTNVLKMNNYFKNAVALYEYITAYNKEGFTVTEIKKDLNPFSAILADELSEITTLTAFLSYKYGNNIEEILELKYQEEEKRRRLEEEKKLIEQIKRLKKHLYESESNIDEYIILLEKRNKMLEEDSDELYKSRKIINDLNSKIIDLNSQKDELNRKIIDLEAVIKAKLEEIDELNQKYIDDLNNLKIEHNNDLEKKSLEFEELKQIAIDEALIDYNDKINSLNDEINNLINKHNEMINNYEEKINSFNNSINEANSLRNNLINDYEKKLKEQKEKLLKNLNELEEINKKTLEEKIFYRAELNAIRVKNGLLEANMDLTSRERFEELEDEFSAFNEFFKKQWKKTKKEIRRQILWSKEEQKPKD